MWCSPKFGLSVSRLVQRYLCGNVTTEESQIAAVGMQQGVVGWDSARDKSLETIKERQGLMRGIPGINAGDYAKFNNSMNQTILGFEGSTSQYKKNNGIGSNKSLADFMTVPQLRVRSLMDALVESKMVKDGVNNVTDLTRIRDETNLELVNVCGNVRRLGGEIGVRKIIKRKREEEEILITGVFFEERDNRWCVTWKDIITKKRRYKSFPSTRYGYEGARRMAIETKREMEIITNN